MCYLGTAFATSSHLQAQALSDAHSLQRSTRQISQIIPHLFISDLTTARRRDTLIKHHISHIITVMALEVELPGDHELERLQISVADEPQAPLLSRFDETTQFIKNALTDGGNVLVHCAQGISRSVTVVCAFLIATRGMSAKQAVDFVQTKRWAAAPNIGFRAQLETYAAQLRPESVHAASVAEKGAKALVRRGLDAFTRRRRWEASQGGMHVAHALSQHPEGGIGMYMSHQRQSLFLTFDYPISDMSSSSYHDDDDVC